MYSRYKDGIVRKYANTVFTQIILNTQDPIITIIVGTTLLPSAREAAMVLSIKAENP